MTEVNMTEEKYDFEPATVADALAWVQKLNEEVHTLPITKEEIEATFNFAVSADIAEVFGDAH
jgi:endonuclease/exonuclease/phosphatase (EEP) superfamily protein YafD